MTVSLCRPSPSLNISTDLIVPSSQWSLKERKSSLRRREWSNKTQERRPGLLHNLLWRKVLSRGLRRRMTSGAETGNIHYPPRNYGRAWQGQGYDSELIIAQRGGEDSERTHPPNRFIPLPKEIKLTVRINCGTGRHGDRGFEGEGGRGWDEQLTEISFNNLRFPIMLFLSEILEEMCRRLIRSFLRSRVRYELGRAGGVPEMDRSPRNRLRKSLIYPMVLGDSYWSFWGPTAPPERRRVTALCWTWWIK